MARAEPRLAASKRSGRAWRLAVAFLGGVGADEPGGPRRSGDRADGSGMLRDTNLDDSEAKSSIIGRAPTDI